MPRQTRNKAAATLHGQVFTALLGEDSPRLQEDTPQETPAPVGESARGLLMKCPSCGRRMELDPGFAGSVCRCNHCKALITVPGELRADSTPMKRRSDRPDSPQDKKKSKQKSPAPASPVAKLDPIHDSGLRIPLPESLESPHPPTPVAVEQDPIAAFAAQANMSMSARPRRASPLTAAQWGMILAIAAGIGLLIALALVELLLG